MKKLGLAVLLASAIVTFAGKSEAKYTLSQYDAHYLSCADVASKRAPKFNDFVSYAATSDEVWDRFFKQCMYEYGYDLQDDTQIQG